ncbi:MAG: transporter [Paludibacteraceae bacterium]|nr:transporter [Paludibacteraceae bacterium]
MKHLLNIVRTYILPLAILVGCLAYKYLAEYGSMTPYLLAVMMFLAFCKINPSKLRFKLWHLWVLLIQIGGSLLLYAIFRPIDNVLAQGMMVCVLAPTAIAAAVITSKLGGEVESLTAFTVISNLAVSIVVPILFPLIVESDVHPDFLTGFLTIISRVFPLLLGPLAVAFLMQKIAPKFVAICLKYKNVDFYILALSIAIVSARTVQSLVEDEYNGLIAIALAVGSLVITIALFIIGKKVGQPYNDRISAGQALGQKNNILAIWMTQTYLGATGPIAAIGPSMYVLWQNLVNTYQIWRVQHGKQI